MLSNGEQLGTHRRESEKLLAETTFKLPCRGWDKKKGRRVAHAPRRDTFPLHPALAAAPRAAPARAFPDQSSASETPRQPWERVNTTEHRSQLR